MRVYIGCDHAGFKLKNAVVEHLREHDYEVTDCGPQIYDAEDDYPPFCIDAAERVAADPGSLGIVIGGSGNGEQIAANKVVGVRCALAYDHDTASLAREHNDANVVGIGARMHSTEEAIAIIDTFLKTPFSMGERHRRRINLLVDYEHSRTHH